jgi:protein-disulfide isomerase
MGKTVAMVAVRMVAMALAVSTVPHAASAQGSADVGALRKEIESLKGDLAEIKKSLAEMRQLLLQRPAAAPAAVPAAPAVVKVTLGNQPSLGRADAPVTIVEFSDYQCPFCQRFVNATFPEIKRDYIDTGKVRYVFRDFPLDPIHPQARKAAEAAHCAGEQGKYWEMHDLLFRNQRALLVDHLKGYGRSLGLDADRFDACLDQGRFAARVEDEAATGSSLGVTGTPAFFIGKSTATGTIEATSVRGAQPAAAFRRVLDQMLDGKAGT